MTVEPIVWTNEHLVGIAALDDDHRKLVLLFNELLAACSAGAGNGIIDRAMAATISLTQDHFQREEHCLENAGYPRIEAHRQEHRALLKQLLSFGSQLTGGAPMCVDPSVAGFLREWAVRHILGHDRDYLGHLRNAPSADCDQRGSLSPSSLSGLTRQSKDPRVKPGDDGKEGDPT